MAQEGTPILMYHSISEGAGRAFAPYCVAPGLFSAHLAAMADAGYRTLTLSDLVASRLRREALAKKTVVITFDDGLADFYELALPALVDHGMTATHYITCGSPGGTASFLSAIGEGHRKLMGWGEIRACAEQGLEIGAHTVKHAAVDLMPKQAARAEIADSRKTIEDAIGIPVTTFAYPFGYANRIVRDLVADAGYASACAVNYRRSPPDEDNFMLSRVIVRAGCSPEELLQKLEGSGAHGETLRDHTRSALRRALRHIPARVLQ
jgi:peptidoglycan/xylan/chitin deacetylase (PgdA/CDA1 family)